MIRSFAAITAGTADADIDGLIVAGALSAMLAAQLAQARRLMDPAKRKRFMLDLHSRQAVQDPWQLKRLIREEAEAFESWAADFGHTRYLMELLGANDDAIDEYQKQVREAAEEVLCQS